MRAAFPNPDGDLLPGMYVRVAIEQAEQRDALALPHQAVQYDAGGQSFIYVVGEGDTFERRVVQTNRLIGTRMVVSGDIAPGDRVIVEGFQKVQPGAEVVPAEWTTVAAASGNAMKAN